MKDATRQQAMEVLRQWGDVPTGADEDELVRRLVDRLAHATRERTEVARQTAMSNAVLAEMERMLRNGRLHERDRTKLERALQEAGERHGSGRWQLGGELLSGVRREALADLMRGDDGVGPEAVEVVELTDRARLVVRSGPTGEVERRVLADLPERPGERTAAAAAYALAAVLRQLLTAGHAAGRAAGKGAME